MKTEISPWSNLAIRILQELARQGSPVAPDVLAAKVPATVSFTSHVLGSFQRRGWVEETFGGVRYARPDPPPSLLDVIEVVEGAPRPDACVLREGSTCGAISGEPYCALHDGWLRARFALLDQLAATPAI
jgi:DNA-binding IscR family transcriptional regulator